MREHRYRLPAALAAAGLALVAGVARADADDDQAPKPVTLAPALRHKLGFETAALQSATAAPRLTGYLKVLDVGPLAQLDADIQAAAAAAAASQAEAARSRTLHAENETISTKALEAAVAQARGDSAKLLTLRRRVGLEWGDGLARLSDRQRGALLTALAAGSAVIVRLDTPSGQGLAGLRRARLDLGPRGVVEADILGAARSGDPHLLSPGVVGVVRGRAARLLSTGLTLPMTLEGASAATGVVAPRAALIRSDGHTWVYVQAGPDIFLRRPADGVPYKDLGLFVAGGLTAGQRVATTGAAALFAAETNHGDVGGD